MAYKISTLPITEGLQVFQKVTFPIFTNIKNDKERLLKAYIKSAFLVLLASLPFGLLFIGFPEIVVTVVLGKDWLAIVPVLRVLTIYGVIQSISATTNSLFYSVNKNNYVALFTFMNLLGMLVLILPMVKSYGITGAAYSVLFGALLSAVVRVYFLYMFIKKK